MRQPSLSKTAAAATVFKDSSIHPKCHIKKPQQSNKTPTC